MATITINIDKVREALKPALAYQPRVVPTITAEEKSPLVIIELPGAKAIDLKALESVSTALCGFRIGLRAQVGLANGHFCIAFWKSDILKDYFIEQ
jgi:hypothetical protein